MATLAAKAAGNGTAALFTPLRLGDIALSHRAVMAPLTRCRAPGGVPQPMMKTYYEQRASEGGLIISEATGVGPTADGYPCTPNLYALDALEGWKPIVEAIHGKGGRFFMQLWHCGRASSTDYQPGGAAPMAPSAIAISPEFTITSPKTFQEEAFTTPREMGQADIDAVIADYVGAARNAMELGADGVEIHCASGYLPNQFLNANANQRTDKYGGSIENRCRFVLELAAAVVDAVGSAGKVGLRFSPFGYYLISPDAHTYATYCYLLTELNPLGLAYVHLVEPRNDDLPVLQPDVGARPDTLAPFRQVYAGNIIAAGNYRGASAAAAVQSGAVDAVAFGRLFISNPDLPERLALGAELNRYDRSTFYAQSAEGYIDYPTLAQ